MTEQVEEYVFTIEEPTPDEASLRQAFMTNLPTANP
jgi:hypothetical protein